MPIENPEASCLSHVVLSKEDLYNMSASTSGSLCEQVKYELKSMITDVVYVMLPELSQSLNKDKQEKLKALEDENLSPDKVWIQLS